MALLEDIPKYAFGTAFELTTSAPSTDETTTTTSSSTNAISTSTSTATSSSTPTIDSPTSCSSTSAAERPVAEVRLDESELKELALAAIRLGCRHFDCSPMYKTQHVIGSVIEEATKTMERRELFITSKLPPNMMRVENIERSFMQSLQELRTDYLDLFLIQAPFSTKHIQDDNYFPTDEEGNLLLDHDEAVLENAWLKLADLKQRGLVRYIGLSNVNLEQLLRLNSKHHVDVVQNEYHIYFQDRELFDQCEEIDVHFEAYAAFGSPIRAKLDGRPCALDDPLVNKVAQENNLSAAQVTMQWVHQQPLSYVIRTDNLSQLTENLESIDCNNDENDEDQANRRISTLSNKNPIVSVNDMIELDRLNKNVRIYSFDQHKNISKHQEYPFCKLPFPPQQPQIVHQNAFLFYKQQFRKMYQT